MNLRRHDLNLLPVLDALIRHRNLTRAGKELALSQPAVSNALTRLRRLFDDPLLLTQGRSMILSPRAEQLSGPLNDLLEAMDKLLNATSFDPSTSDRRFRISTADYVTFLFLPKLLRRLEKEAPKVSIQVFWNQVVWEPEVKASKLRLHEMDLAIVPRGSLNVADVCSESLIDDDLVVITSKDHPDLGNGLTREQFEKLLLARIRMEDPRLTTFVDLQLMQNQMVIDDVALVSNNLLLPFLLDGTRYAAVLSRRLAQKLQKTANIALHDLPFPAAKLHLDLHWTRAANSDPGLIWLRKVLREECENL